MDSKKPTIFISYNQKSGNAIADQIQKRLEPIAWVVRDKTSIPDWGSINDFMKTIRNQDLVVMVITAEFLKSSGCMFEVAQAMKDEDWHTHTMFVVADDAADIYIPKNWACYLEHWRQEEAELNHEIELIGDSAKTIKLSEELRKVKETQYSLLDFLSKVADAKNPNITEAVEKIYQRVNKSISETEDSMEVSHFLSSDELGNPETLYSLGRCYLKGDGKEQDYIKAVQCYRQAAELGHAGAQCNLGIMYEQGKGIRIDEGKARYWYQKSAEQGDVVAQFLLAHIILIQSNGSKVEKLKAAEWYKKAAEQGYINAQSALGKMYKNGHGVKQDYEKAKYWFQKAYQLTRQSAELGNSDAQYSLGNMYKHGTDVLEKNKEAAAEWYRKAARLGNSNAQFALGELYENGEGVTKSYAESMNWYKKAGAQGNINALLRLGDMYTTGIEKDYLNAQKNYKAAENLLKKLAEHGKVSSQMRLASLYKNGRIGEPDYDKAIYWYEKAAAAGNTSAMYDLYQVYQNKQVYSPETAIKWLQQAASQGNITAMMRLGKMYENGDEVEKNDDMAIFWYQRTASIGFSPAIKNLGNMYEQGIGTDSNIKKAVALYTKYAYRGINFACQRLGYLYENGLGVEQNDSEAAVWYQEAAEYGDTNA